MIRFYPPPPEWGTVVDLDCAANGGPPEHHVIDIDDLSTYVQEAALLTHRIIGTRPALTGDPSTIPQADLLKAGYRPRPDAARSPEKYAKWLADVTQPMNIVWAKGVAVIGQRAANFSGRFNSSIWSGQILDAAGFNNGAPNHNFSTYTEYEIEAYVPPTQQDQTPCGATLWGGLGGYNDGALIQSGVGVTQQAALWYEYFQQAKGGSSSTGPVTLVPSYDMTVSVGDLFYAWGWAADIHGNMNANGGWAYYSFEDATNREITSDLFWEADTSGEYDEFTGNTVEWIMEKNTSFELTKFQNALISGIGWDFQGNLHTSSTDPWIFLDINPSGGNWSYLDYAYNPNNDPDTANDYYINFEWLAGGCCN